MGKTLVLLSSLLAATGPACSGSTPPVQEPLPDATAASKSATAPVTPAAPSSSVRASPPPGTSTETAPKVSPHGSVTAPTANGATANGATANEATANEATANEATANEAARVQTLFVHENRVDCEGAMPMKCLQVRESEHDEWSYFYSTIEGFDYEESFRYELRVEVEPVANVPMDKTVTHYRLLEVVSKRPARK